MDAILWDNDGVLVDTEGLYFEASRRVLAELGFELGEERFVELSLVRGESAFEIARAEGVAEDTIRDALVRRDEEYLRLIESADDLVCDGVTETLDELEGRYRMGIVTSSLRVHFDAIHATSGLLDRFEFVLVREDYGRSKPDPEPYLAAVERFGLDPARSIVVEDTERGVRAAFRAGLRCLAVPHALSASGAFSVATRVLGGVREVPAVLRDLGLPGR
jgi:HAD superfamily hydrolase (TIGR01509 family)